MADLTLTDGILSIFEKLGVGRAHLAAQSPSDITGLIEQYPERVGGIALIAPPRMDPVPFAPFSGDVLYVAPEGGMLSKTAAGVLPRLPKAASAILEGYSAESWSDLAADRPDLADRLTEHFSKLSSVDSASGTSTSGQIAGIRYRAFGSGPVLVLTPLAFAPSQWEPLLPILAERFRIIALSGPRLGMLAFLEERAALSDWKHMCAGAFNGLSLSPGDSVLEVGCGSGAISRQFNRYTDGNNPLTAIDISRYLLGEARISAEQSEMAEGITFKEGSAENLPFEANTFDAAYTVTVLEECNAEKALAELVRVVKPGGRVSVVVRGIDLPQWWNMQLSPEIRVKLAESAPSIAPGGVATGALYQLAIAAGMKPLRMNTFCVASESCSGPFFEYPEMHGLSQLNTKEQQAYQISKAEAVASGTLFVTRGHHCFVGEVPKA